MFFLKNVNLELALVVDGESQITCTLSPQLLQSLIKEASEKEEWNKLRFLFLGTVASKTSKGLAYECDASCVPLDLLIQSDVKDLHKLVTLLLQQGTSPTGLRGCVRPPLLVAMEMMNFPLAVTLLRNNADPSCIVGHGIFINREVNVIFLYVAQKLLNIRRYSYLG